MMTRAGTMAKSGIGYTNDKVSWYWSWEPCGYGCSRRCMTPRKCWAEQDAVRQRRHCPDCADFKVHFHEERLLQPATTKKAGIALTGFHSDLFDLKRPYAQIVAVFQQIASCPQHSFVLLTQNAERLAKFYQDWWRPDRYKYFTRGGRRRRSPRLFLRRPGCSECASHFLGCLRGRKEWKDEAVTPNLRETGTRDFFGHPERICDGFRWHRDAQGHGCAVEMNAGEISVRQCDLLGPFPAPLKNIYHGLTIRTQAEADQKLAVFLQIPGKLWLSLEPLWGDVALCDPRIGAWIPSYGDRVKGVIVGHDNRRGAPGTDTLRHVRSVVKQCRAGGIPVYVKQLWIDGNSFRRDPAEFPPNLRIRDLPWTMPKGC